MRVDDLIFDVGLHRGEDADFYLRKGYRVVAFEANPELVGHCKNRFDEPIKAGRLTIVEGAIAPASAGDTLTFYKNEQMSTWGTINKEWAGRNEQLGDASIAIQTPRVDVDEAYRRFGVPYYLKVDIEGVDRLVIETLRSHAERPQYISMEAEKTDFDALVEDLNLFRELGYRKFKSVQQATIPRRRVRVKTLDGGEIEYEFAKDASGPFGEDIPQPWLTYDEAVREQRSIYRRYRLFGDETIFNKTKAGRIATIAARRLTGKPLAGWYDIHASL
jgi:FkbM family methyltransferase